MKIAFVSLGCSKNQSDLEYFMGDIVNDGHTIVTKIEDSDVTIINTCGFIQPAVSEAIDNILDVAESKSSHTKIVVAGCMVERYKNELIKQMPEIDFASGVGNFYKIREYINQKCETNKKLDVDKNKYFYSNNRIISNIPYYAYIKISEGCNNRCSYCTIPSIRGNLVSRDMNEILEEAVSLVKNGIKELIIISQDITKYGIDLYKKPMLPTLLRKIIEIDGDFHIRTLYMNPDGITDNLLDVYSESDKILKYFEIPVQHISDKILSLMNRKSNSIIIKDLFKKIKERFQDSTIRTTFIVGFPTEDESDFEMVKSFITENKPDYAGFFPYYDEDGTVAEKLECKIDKKVVNKRIKILEKLQIKNSMNMLKKYKKTPFLCYAEEKNEEFDFIVNGRAIFQSPEIDGKSYIIEGEIDKGYGPYLCKIIKIKYPDIYCKRI